MPAKLERCVKDVISSGRSKSSAYAICNASSDKKKKKRRKGKKK